MNIYKYVDYYLDNALTLWQNGDSEYPIISKKPELRNFNGHLVSFWRSFITKAQDKILYDEVFMDSITTVLTNFTK